MIVNIIPTPIFSEFSSDDLTHDVISITKNTNCFFVEKAKTARNFLKQINHPLPINKIEIIEINRTDGINEFKKIVEKKSFPQVGLLSEAGCPVIADPGGELIRYAHKKGIAVCSFPGSSSIAHSLMLSGFNGQNFAFHGYLPHPNIEKIQRLRKYCNRSLIEQETQIFIETPYRTYQLLRFLINWNHSFDKPNNQNNINTNKKTPDQLKINQKQSKRLFLAVVASILSKSEKVLVKSINEWQIQDTQLFKGLPAVFLLSYL